MPNKVRDIFSDEKFNISSTLHFSDTEACKNFLSALETVYNEGRVVLVEGVTSIAGAVGHMGSNFPLEEHADIGGFLVGPVTEPIPVTLSVNGEEKTITMLRSQTKEKVVLRSQPNSIVVFEFTCPNSKNVCTVSYNYKVQFENAKNVEEVADSFSIADAILTSLNGQEKNTPTENSNVSISDVREYFRFYKTFFKHLSAIESKLAISISPSMLNELPCEEQRDIDELYLLLCDKKVVRSNAKLISIDSSEEPINLEKTPLSIGQKIALTFLHNIEFKFLGQTVILYTANLLINAFVKDIQKNDDGTLKILYGDTDSKPMYISFSAFETIEEAKQELDAISQRIGIYTNAQTSNTYINQYYEEKR